MNIRPVGHICLFRMNWLALRRHAASFSIDLSFAVPTALLEFVAFFRQFQHVDTGIARLPQQLGRWRI